MSHKGCWGPLPCRGFKLTANGSICGWKRGTCRCGCPAESIMTIWADVGMLYSRDGVVDLRLVFRVGRR